jgi:hypothetical protein
VLAARLREQGAPAFCSWPTWEQVLLMSAHWPLLIGGQNWCHWVGVRQSYGGVLVLANSAPGWMSVTDILTETDWPVLGPFACVAVPLLVNFPPT